MRRDARLALVSLAFLASAGFLALHALATPGVLLPGPNAGFVVATPVGLLLAAAFAAASSLELEPERAERVLRLRRPLFSAVVVLILAWAAASLARVPPLDDPVRPEVASGWLAAVAAAGVVLYAVASARYLRLYRRRPALVLLAVVTAFALLAEAMVAVALARNWHLSWWEWHVLMLAAFGLVASTAWVEYRRSASLVEAFGGLYLEETLARLDRRYPEALRRLVAARRRGETERSAAAMRDELELSGDEAASLARAAEWVVELDAYLSPHVRDRIADPRDESRTITVLFADLAGFTSFAERAEPDEVVAMLNAYLGAAVPILRDEDATIDKFIGDAVMAEFNALVDQPDHALRAARAALTLQAETERIAAAHPGWPTFRVGVNTGEAVVGVVGTAEQRAITVVGDAVNVAARLEEKARPGEVVIGRTTYDLLPAGAQVEPLGAVPVKGREALADAYVLRALPA